MSFTLTNGAPRAEYESGDTITEQDHAQYTDIEYILTKFTREQLLEHNQQFGGQYGDFTSAVDYLEACRIMAEADSMFETLPEEVRRHFPGGTPQFLDFIQDSDNLDKATELGLIPRDRDEVHTDARDNAQQTDPAAKPELGPGSWDGKIQNGTDPADRPD